MHLISVLLVETPNKLTIKVQATPFYIVPFYLISGTPKCKPMYSRAGPLPLTSGTQSMYLP
ncbi:hypothetical protein LB503_005924 [Fusarium chuoi]|nr:hypothetical protein LB503_005924 [Fusarium chuoi]